MSAPVKELWQMAVTGQDDEATRIVCDVARAWQAAPIAESSKIPFYSYRCKPVEDRIAEKSVPPSLVLHFEAAAYLQDKLRGLPQVPLHGNLHHWNIVRGEDDSWKAINPQNVYGPNFIDLANTITNPYDPTLKHPADQSRDLDPDFVLDTKRMERQIIVASEATGWNKGDLATGVFVHAVQVAARRVHGTPPGQVALPYWEKAATLAAGIAGIRLDRGFKAF